MEQLHTRESSPDTVALASAMLGSLPALDIAFVLCLDIPVSLWRRDKGKHGPGLVNRIGCLLVEKEGSGMQEKKISSSDKWGKARNMECSHWDSEVWPS